MHPMHQIQAHNESHIQQQDLSVRQQAQDEQDAHSQQAQQQQLNNMTVLEPLEPVQPGSRGQEQQQQPLLSSLETMNSSQHSPTLIGDSHQHQQPQPPPVIHHLVQAQPPTPHLHLLRAPCQQQESQDHLEAGQHELPQEHLQADQNSQQQQQQLSTNQPAGNNVGRRNGSMAQRHQQLQQRPQQLEGIVADGGGPIVQWLLDNYEIADGESLPRSTVYNHYLAHCRQLRMASVNAASFGKLIRSVFLGLKTRRLGTRGHSKYHYFGVRAKQHVRLDWIQDTTSDHQVGCSGAPGGCSGMMMRDDNSNPNTDNGSESDSTGEYSGRVSSLGGSSVNNNNGNIANNNTSVSVGTNNSNHTGAKRLRRAMQENPADSDMAHAYGGYGPEEPHVVGTHEHPLTDYHHHGQNQVYEDMNQHYVNGSSYYANGYEDKHNVATASSDCWSLDQHDLSSLKNHLGVNNESLVDQHWPPYDPSFLERQLQTRSNQSQAGLSRPEAAALAQSFESQYKAYYKRMVELLANLQFRDIEHLWLEFWHPSPAPVGHEIVHQWVHGQQSVTNTSTSGNNDQHSTGTEHQDGAMPQISYNSSSHQQNVPATPATQMIASNNHLTYNQLYQLTSHPAMIERINQIDYKLYSAIESFLIPDLLIPQPRPLIRLIRSLSRDFGTWLERAIKDYDGNLVSEKMKSVRAFEYALRRYTSINHLATASRAIWTKRSVLAQMSADLNRIDIRDIEHQVSLMTQTKFDQLMNETDEQALGLQTDRIPHETIDSVGEKHNGISRGRETVTISDRDCSQEIQTEFANSRSSSTTRLQQTDNIENSYLSENANQVGSGNRYSDHHNHQNQLSHDGFCLMQPAHLVQDFQHLLDDPYPANVWPDWCRNLVEERVCGESLEEARNFILKWNFYISIILRELTLKSAPSLGSFQLIRLLFDEYMYYLVVGRLAQAQHKTPTQLLRPSIKFENSMLGS